MRRKYRKWYCVFCAVLLIGSLLLSGCTSQPNKQEGTQPSNPTSATQTPVTTEPTHATDPVPTTEQTLPADDVGNESIPDTDWNEDELIGSWDLTWTEVEGDRNEAAPGVCTVEITMDDTGSLWFTYSDRDFPDWNVQERELLIVPGELYSGCGNDQWFGEVRAVSGDGAQFSLTLLDDGTLLLLIYWDMDGMPMVSVGGYCRLS